MSGNVNFEGDVEFAKLLARQSDVDMTIASLELARDVSPELDFDTTLSWIDDRAEELTGCVSRASNEFDALKQFGLCISQRHGVFGDHESYQRADSSYLPRVIETKRGIPISLSVLYMAIGKRIGIELQGVAAPMHFLTRYESIEGPLFVDAFSQGRVMTYNECLNWVSKISDQPPETVKSMLGASDARTTIIRMLTNLKVLYLKQEDWSAAWTVQHRLTALEPASYQQRRDLALVSLRANRPGQAIDLLRWCLKSCPDKEQQLLEQHLDEAHVEITRWN